MKITALFLVLALVAPSTAAPLKVVIKAPRVNLGSTGAAAGAASSLKLPGVGGLGRISVPSLTLKTAPQLSLQAAVSAASAERTSQVVESLRTLDKVVAAPARESGADAASPLAAHYDNSSKEAEIPAAAVSATADISAAPRVQLRAVEPGDSGGFRDEPPTPRRRDIEFEPINFRRAAAGFIVWLVLMGAVAGEYYGIYTLFANAPRAEQQYIPPEFEDAMREFGF